MQGIETILSQLLDKQFVSAYLKEHVGPQVRAQIPRRVLLEESQLVEIRPLLKLLPDRADTGLVGSYKQRLLVCDTTQLPEASSEEGVIEYEGVRFTYFQSLQPMEQWIDETPVTSRRQWLDYRHENDSWKESAYVALEVYDRVRKHKSVSREDIEPVVVSARSQYWVSWDIGIFCLGSLAETHSAAREAIWDLANASHAKLRQRALLMISHHKPKFFCLKILRHGLQDRSKEVRCRAAHRSEIFGLTEMLDDLLLLQKTEKNPDVLGQLEYSIDMFQQGFHYNKKCGSLWVRMGNGTVKSVGGKKYNREYYESHDLKTVVEEIRREFVSPCGQSPQLNWCEEPQVES